MTASVLPRVRPTSYPIGRLLLDLKAALPSYLERTDSSFLRVYIQKFDRDSYPHVRQLKEKFWSIKDIQTDDIYIDEPGWALTLKCILIFETAIFYTGGVMLWNVYQILRCIRIIVKNSFQKMHKCFVSGDYSRAIKILKIKLKPLPAVIKERLWNIVCAPFFGLAIEFAALLGVMRPLHGRKYIAMIDKAWHNGLSYKKDLRRMPRRNNSCCQNFNQKVHSDRELFFAYCFQVRGNLLTDKHLQVIDLFRN